MKQYQANATNPKHFTLTTDNQQVGELIYKKWYSFSATIQLPNGKTCHLEPKGFWDSRVELSDESGVLLEFKMGWKGIIIETFFNKQRETFLLKHKGMLSNQFMLFDTDDEAVMVVDTNYKWSKFNFDFTFETTPKLERLEHTELILLTILHCINYYVTMIAAIS